MIYRRLLFILISLSLIVCAGVIGYKTIEGWAVLDALYMTVITLASVGFMEVHPLSPAGRIFTISLILGGTGMLIYGISTFTALIVEGELTNVLRRRNMQKKIDHLKGHYIVCGADQTGRYVIEELVKTKLDFIVIEKDREKIKQLEDQSIFFVEGDATHNAILQTAGIQTAKGLITALHSDAENLLVVFTAKKLNPDLKVISKAVEEESEQKIRMAGADGVVMPNFIGGLRMVSAMTRPSVVTFLDTMLRSQDKTIRVEEVEIFPGSPFIDRTIGETGIHGIQGVTLVAIRDKSNEDYLFNPPGSRVLTANDLMIVMGDIDRIHELRERARPAASG